MTEFEAIQIAQAVEPYSDAGKKARAIATGRGACPFDAVVVHGCKINAWQAVIVEVLLWESIRADLLS